MTCINVSSWWKTSIQSKNLFDSKDTFFYKPRTDPHRVRRYNTQHNDIQHNDTQHNNIQNNDTQHSDIQHNDTQHNNIVIMPNVIVLSECHVLVIAMLSDVVLSVTLHLLLRWVFLCWMSSFIYCYAEGRYAECRYAECRYAERRYAEWCYAECHYAECRNAECRGASSSNIEPRLPNWN